ncbi:pyridoxamine 5'-phosphate oxidase family protein [bacterium]|nr:pyridoxamine 5'-phosphate oxidase family protein [bacterium]
MVTESKIIQHPERAVPQEAANILQEGLVAHIGFTVMDRPHVIPVSYFYELSKPDRIYIHGGKTSRLMQHLASGAQVCVEVTLLDGLIYSRSAKYHSMNYRSMVCFGRGSAVDLIEEKAEILKKAIERYFPGRQEGKDYQKAPVEHLAATTLVEIRIEEWSAKAREGGPRGPMDADPGAEGTCGILLTALA